MYHKCICSSEGTKINRYNRNMKAKDSRMTDAKDQAQVMLTDADELGDLIERMLTAAAAEVVAELKAMFSDTGKNDR